MLLAVLSGLGLLLGAFLAGLPRQWRADAPLAAAVTAMVAFDVVSLALGGSFWRDYLFGLVPGALLATALVGPRLRVGLGR